MNTSETIQPHRRETTGGSGADNLRTIGRIVGWERLDASKVIVRGERASIAVAAVASRILRVLHVPVGAPDWMTTPAVIGPADPPPALEVTETENELVLRGGDAELAIRKADGRQRAGLAEDLSGGGEAIRAEHRLAWDAKGAVTCIGELAERSRVYGLGETTAFLDKRGERYVMWNSDVFDPHVPETESLYQSIPLLIHFHEGRAYGVFFDNPGRITVDLRASRDRYQVTTHTGRMDRYLIFGPTLKDVVMNYTSLTGHMPMPPLWAIGYHQSRYSYKSQEEVLAIARTFREKNIPCDAIYLDIHHMDGYRVFTFHPEHFPDPRSMVNELEEMGFHAVPIVDPGVKRDARFRVYREGVQGGHFCKKLEGDLFIGKVWPGDSAFPDFTDPATRQWWGGLHRAFTDLGIRGIWNDMNEPSVFDCELKTMDLDVVHANGGDPKTHEELHNLYGLLMSQATYEGLRGLLGGERPFVVTRAGYAGIQRYAAVWTGDNRSYWEHLAMSMPMMMNLGLSGVAFCGADVGGFGHHASGELLARWTQLGAFSPFFRNHCLDNMQDQEPWRFGERVEAICRDYISLRYRWLPHLYTLFREAAATGVPILRPLVLEYPDDPNTYNLCDQFLFGADVLVAPVCRPDTAVRSVYLPRGEWIDYWTGERYAGGRHILADAPLEKLPIYVRAGAILPEQPVRQHAGERPADEAGGRLTFRLYAAAPGGRSVYELFEDDGLTFAYKTGAYNTIRVEAEYGEEAVRIRCGYAHRGYETVRNAVTLILHHLPFVPRTVTDGEGQGLEWRYDADRRELTVACPLAGETMTVMTVR